MSKIIRLTESELVKLIKNIIKEDEGSSSCGSPESKESLVKIETAAQNIAKTLKELEITQEDIDGSESDGPEAEKLKMELFNISKPIVSNLDAQGLKKLIKSVKQIIKGKQSVQEQQFDSDSFFKPIIDLFNKIPKQLLWIVGIWYIARCFRCLIYKLEMGIVGGCGLQWKSSILGRVTQLIFLDFRNLRSDDPSTIECFGNGSGD
jgi:hypothetical protein